MEKKILKEPLTTFHMNLRLTAILITCMLAAQAVALDWSNWRGPDRNNISPETNWTEKWPDAGPREIWRADVQLGFGSMVVSEKRIFTLGHDGEKTVTLYCLDAISGKTKWKHSWQSDLGDKYFEGGPVSTPTVDERRVYVLGRWGSILCLHAEKGEIIWQRDLVKEEGVRVPTWGFAGATVIDGDTLFLNVGEAGMALSKVTGKTLWSSARRAAGYSTPMLFKAEGKDYVLFSSGKEYTAVERATGKPWWSYRWLTRYGVNAADPIVTDDGHAFISSGYGKGSAYIKMYREDPETLWKNRDFRNQMCTSLLIDGHLYGVDGDTGKNAANLKCVTLKTGKVQWTHKDFGSGNLIASNGKLICLSGKGELIIAPISKTSFKPTARAQVLQGKCWNPHVLANGYLYCRNADGDLICLDLRKEDETP